MLALESDRARCLVVGEDLGTVPAGFRERLAAADVLSYRVLWFERDGSGFAPPSRYPAKAVACVSTHDLPTVAGWWSGADIDEKRSLGLLDRRRRRRRAGRRDWPTSRRCPRRSARPASAQARRSTADAPHDAAITAAIHRYRLRVAVGAGADPGRRPRR